ncbi:hypothetical protein HC761_01805 [bacterium]|nr:hypothetical protein [bacterium]
MRTLTQISLVQWLVALAVYGIFSNDVSAAPLSRTSAEQRLQAWAQHQALQKAACFRAYSGAPLAQSPKAGAWLILSLRQMMLRRSTLHTQRAASGKVRITGNRSSP